MPRDYSKVNTPARQLSDVYCPDCGCSLAIQVKTPSNDPVNFPGHYTSTACPACKFHEFEYAPDETLKPGDMVKFAPDLYIDEAGAVYRVVELRGPRCLIELVCSLPLPPQSAAMVHELRKV